MRKRTIRASEIGTYLFCKRAWWYQLQGKQSENQQEMAGGFAYHRQTRAVCFTSHAFQSGAWILLIAAFVLVIIWLTGKALSYNMIIAALLLLVMPWSYSGSVAEDRHRVVCQLDALFTPTRNYWERWKNRFLTRT